MANVLQHYSPCIKSIHDLHYNKTENVLQQYSPCIKSIHNLHYNKILFVLYEHNYHSIIMLIRYYSMTSCLQLQYMQHIIIIRLPGIIVIHFLYNTIHLPYYDTTHDGIELVHSVLFNIISFYNQTKSKPICVNITDCTGVHVFDLGQ